MSPTEVFAGTPYFDVFWLAISIRISWYALSNPYVRMMTELLSSKFRSLMILNKSFLESVGSPSVRNKITRFLLFSEFLEIEPFSNSNAFSKAGMNFVRSPVKNKEEQYQHTLLKKSFGPSLQIWRLSAKVGEENGLFNGFTFGQNKVYINLSKSLSYSSTLNLQFIVRLTVVGRMCN